MIDIKRKLKNFGPLEALVLGSIVYVVTMLLWTASTRSEVLQKANDIKSNHKLVVDFINNEVNNCSSNAEGLTSWGEKCNSVWTSDKIVDHLLSNVDLKNPYSINEPLGTYLSISEACSRGVLSWYNKERIVLPLV